MRPTCGDVCVEDGAVHQGPRIPAAHVFTLLGEVCFVAFLQHRLEVLGWTLRKAKQ